MYMLQTLKKYLQAVKNLKIDLMTVPISYKEINSGWNSAAVLTFILSPVHMYVSITYIVSNRI